MELPNLTLVDGLAAVFLAISVLHGYLRGGLREIFGISSWVAAFFVAFAFTPALRPMMPEIGLLGDFADACLIATFLAFLALLLLTLAGLSMIAPAVPKTSGTSVSGINRLLGLTIGFLRGAVILVACWIVYDALAPGAQKSDLVTSAATADILDAGAAWARSMVPADAPDWLGGQLAELTTECRSPLNLLPGIGAAETTIDSLPSTDSLVDSLPAPEQNVD